MPNWVTNEVHADDPAVIRALLDENDNVDFNKIIPMPDEVNKSPLLSMDDMQAGPNWYNWSVSNWGTKWNACETTLLSRNTVRFETAWSHPFPVMDKLCQMFPDATISIRFADEDMGSNLGEYTAHNLSIVSKNQPVTGSDEALELAAQIIYGASYAEVSRDW